MGYHDRNLYETRWSSKSNEKEETENPKIKIISPQKKLIDIQAALDKARNGPVTMYELHTEIQKILDGE